MSARSTATVARTLFATVAPVCAAMGLLACGGGGDGGTAPPASTRYEGVLTSGVERGVLVLQSGSPASGALTLGENAPVALTGTSANGKFTLTGGGYTVSATATANGALLGTVTGGELQAQANFGALASPDSGTSVRYCGVYTGGDAGMGDVLVQGTRAVATVTGMGGGFSIPGTATATTVNMRLDGIETGTNRPMTITANLARTADTLVGTAENSLYVDDVPTTVVATRGGCRSAAAPGNIHHFYGVITAPRKMWRVRLQRGNTIQTAPDVVGRVTGFIGDSVSGPIAVEGTYAEGARVLAVNGSGISLRATVTTRRTFTGTVTATGAPGVVVNGGNVDGIVGGDFDTPPQLYCGAMDGLIRGPIIVAADQVTAQAFVLDDLMPRRLGGAFGGSWIYFTDGYHTFWAAHLSRTAPASQQFTGSWSNDTPLVGTWQVRPCP